MNLQGIRNALTSRVGHQLLVGQKHAPTILFVAGAVGVIGTVVLACRATLKVEEVLDEHENRKNMADKALVSELVEYSISDHKRDTILLQVKLITNLTKLYAPAIAMGLASVAALTGSHVVLNRRYLGVTAAYAGVEKAFEAYRRRVVNEYGTEKDTEFHYGLVDKEIVEETEEGAVVKTIKAIDPSALGSNPYVRVFDRTSSKSWQKEPGYNRTFIMCQQEYMNQLLRARGHVFLNDVFDALGLERSSVGAVTGWVLDRDDNCGDGYIDFGVFEGDRYKGMEFVKGDERSVVLDFNVDGVIWDKI